MEKIRKGNTQTNQVEQTQLSEESFDYSKQFDKKYQEFICRSNYCMQREWVTIKKQIILRYYQMKIREFQFFFNEGSKQNIKEATQKVESKSNFYNDINQQMYRLRQEYQQLLKKKKQIVFSSSQQKLYLLIQYLRRKFDEETIINKNYTIIKQLYKLLEEIQSQNCRRNKIMKVLRKINQVIDNLSYYDLFKDTNQMLNSSFQSFLSQNLEPNKNILLIFRRQMMKAYMHYLAFYNKSNLWFVKLFQTKINQENSNKVQSHIQSKSQKQSLLIRQNSDVLISRSSQNNLTRKDDLNLLIKLTHALLPYQFCAFAEDNFHETNYLIIKLSDQQEDNSLKQINKIMLYYNAAQSNLVPVLQSLKKLGTQDSSQRQLLQKINKTFLPQVQLKQNLQIIDKVIRYFSNLNVYQCSSIHLINNPSFRKSIQYTHKLHTLLINITEQLLELHQKQYSLCCPLEFSMNINITNLQVAFFYIGHPRSLVNFINNKITSQSKEDLAKYYPVQQILELAGSPNKDFRRIDVWMLGGSVKRLIENIQYLWITKSDYCLNIMKMINRQMMVEPQQRMKLGYFKKQLMLFEMEYL